LSVKISISIGVVELRKNGIENFLVDVGAKYLNLFFDQVSISLRVSAEIS
jgi:hypothetical protein